ncbi:hypothetical protein L204_104851 [Cryptococcus depauperatus]|nr:endonuclease III [Cryptococcus depauperatus CBS 7855]
MVRKGILKPTVSALNNHANISSVDPALSKMPSSKSASTNTRHTRSSAACNVKTLPPVKPRELDIAKYKYQPSTLSPRKKPKLEVGKEIKAEGSPPTPKSAKKPIPLSALSKPHPAPANWEEQYRLIEQMRRGIVAPVDDMGCERPRTSAEGNPKTFRFHILISLMLSAQTKDAVTSAAVSSLHDTIPGGLTAESLAVAPLEMVQECINKVGFWRRKAEYIQVAAHKLLEQEGDARGDVPKTIEGLCELKGVGPKMAFLALQCAWNINAGIGVDVHVHRITNRLRWHRPPTTTPEQTRLNLQSWLPTHLHKPINPLLVGFGQVVCLPVGPRCDICLLGSKKICPSRISGANGKGRKEIAYTFKDEADGIAVGTWEWGQNQSLIKEEVKLEPKINVRYEGLVLNKDKPDSSVKMETTQGIDQDIEEPGMKRTDQVLEVLDQVDGTVDIGSDPTVKKESVDW